VQTNSSVHIWPSKKPQAWHERMLFPIKEENFSVPRRLDCKAQISMNCDVLAKSICIEIRNFCHL